jgi:uncharacterized membrane protein
MSARSAKRTGTLVSTGAILTILLLLGCSAIAALPSLPRPGDSDSDSGTSGASQSPGRATSYDDKVYFRANSTQSAPYMNTIPPTGQSQTRTLPVEIPMDNPLGTAVKIIGKDLSTGGKGMWVWFSITGPPGAVNQITIEILEDNTTVAAATVPNTQGQFRWDVPFTSGQEHTFPSGSVIKVKVASSLPTIMAINNNNAYLLMPLTEPPISVGVGTYYAQGKPSSEFHPNAPDTIRHIRTEGDIVSLFGPSDLSEVLVTIRNPMGDAVSNGTASITGTHYLAQWNYSKGQPAGNYNITVKVADRQGHDYYTYTVVTMQKFAVFISSSQDYSDVVQGGASPPRGGSNARDAVYTLRVLNSGATATGVTVRVSSNPPPGWTASISPPSFSSINPGSFESVTMTVSASEEVEFGDKAVIYIEAIAESDSKVPKASWTLQSVTNATMSRNFEFTLMGATETWVDVGQTATYQLMLRNKGILDMNVTLSVSGIPVGWSYQIDVNTKIYLDTGTNSEKSVNLRVTAPSEEVANLSRIAQISIKAQVVEEPTMDKQVTTVTRLITILGLSVSPSVQTSDSSILSGKVDFRTTINNLDPLNSHQVRITVTQPGEWPSTSVKYDPKETLLSPNGTTTITISVTPPSTAEANEVTGYTLGIKIEPMDQPTRSNSTVVTLKVKQRYAISLTVSANSLEVKPGKTASVTLTVKNDGNGNDSAILYIAASGIPQDWKVKLNEVLSPLPLTVALTATGRAGSTVTVTLIVQPSDASKDGEKVNITVTAKSPHASEVSASVGTTVKKEFNAKVWDALWDSALLILLTCFVLVIFAVVRRRSIRGA